MERGSTVNIGHVDAAGVLRDDVFGYVVSAKTGGLQNLCRCDF